MHTEPDPVEYSYPEPFCVEAGDHTLTFLPDGVHRFDALLELVQEAQESLHLFYYMFQDDEAGNPVRDALVEAAERGVTVCLVVDRFGTDADKEFFQPIVDAGGSFAFFNPKKSRRYLIRNHQKMAIADREKALVGGFNVSEHYFKPPEENGWCDMGVIVRGPLVEQLLDWYGQIYDWATTPSAQYRAIRTMVRDWEPGDGKYQLLVGGPTSIPSNWARRVKKDLAHASKLDLVMAYFSPPRSFRRLIRRVGERGKVRLVMAAKSDNPATVSAARATYGSMLRAGCEVYEFQPCKLHMKLLVIDDAVYFGSANFDHRSIRLNLELMFRVEDPDLAKMVREFVDGMTEVSEQITYESHKKNRTWLSTLKSYFGWFLVTTVDYTVSSTLNVGSEGAP
ncbi:phospholipase D-like domain-containing protein [Erythrobacter litoralis]|uniref:phospholipase D-like domain-containing protein n=1 Tax=Erythrobacter litoralis TaxID=39960 RepID=UPI00031E9AB9|nr:cardiolipin synthase B [Erythrobacter litoralis]